MTNENTVVNLKASNFVQSLQIISVDDSNLNILDKGVPQTSDI